MKKYILATILLLFSFVFLLLSSFLLDDSKIKNNVSKSLSNYNFLDNKKYDLDIDNYTDMIILNVITYHSENSVIKRAFGNEYGILYVNRYGDKEIYWNMYENLNASLDLANEDSIFYGRYWHGCQSIIKPLLRFFTYQQSLFFLSIMGIVLIIISFILLFKKLGWKFLSIYFLSLLSLNIYVFNLCYQYFFTMILMIIFNIVILLKYKKNNFNNCLYFYIFGGLASYFMYISFPLITLCYPLIVFLALQFKNDKYLNYKENIMTVVKSSISWIIGYVLFYVLKWIIGTIFVGTNFIEDALLSISQRLGITFSFNYFDVLRLNLTYFFNNKLNIILCIIILVILVIKLKKNFKEKLKIISPLLLVSIMPFVWMFICNNHSAVHYWMISRLFSISIFALLFIILFISKDMKYDTLEKLTFNDYILLVVLMLFFLLYKFNLVFILVCLIIVIFLKFEKKSKIFIILLMGLSSFLLISKLLNKNNFNNKYFFQNIYYELYHKAISYGVEYANKNGIITETKVDLRDLIEKVNADSVFLLSCKGYVIIDFDDVKPYINCDDVMVTEGYKKGD